MIGEAVWRLLLDGHTLSEIRTGQELAGLHELTTAVVFALQARSLTLGRLDALAGL